MKKMIFAVVAAVGVVVAVGCGGGGGQSAECKNYVACYEKTGGTKGSLDSTYGAMGTCWSVSSTTEGCNAACKTANDSYKSTGLGADAGCTFTE